MGEVGFVKTLWGKSGVSAT